MVEAILDGRRPAELRLDGLLEKFPLECEGQRGTIGENVFIWKEQKGTPVK